MMRDSRGPAPGRISRGNKSASHYDPWQKSRLAEDERQKRGKLTREQAKFDLRSLWEDQTRKRMIEAETRRRFLAVKAKDHHEREKQREQLRQLIESEENHLMTTGKSLEEEIRERYEESRRRAQQLEQERQEADRLQALEKYEQQFREGCDLIRGEMSRRMAYEIAEDRKIQIAMKQQQKKLEEAEDAWFAEIMRQEAGNQKEDNTNKHDIYESLAKQLQAQILEKQEVQKQDEEQKRKERDDLLQLQREMQEEKIRQHQSEMEKRTKVKEDLDQCLYAKQQRINEELEKLKAYETLLGKEEEIEKLAEADSLKESKKRERDETIQYLNYVQQSKKEAEVLESHVNQLIEEAVQREAKRVQEVRRREKLARETLTQQTAEFCLQQIQEKDNARQKALDEKKTTTREYNERIEKDRKKIEEELHEHQNRLIQYRQALEDQIAHRKKMVASSMEEAEREQNAIRETEFNIHNVINEVVHTKIGNANRHPWRVLLAQGHPGVPQWTGSLQSPTFGTKSQ